MTLVLQCSIRLQVMKLLDLCPWIPQIKVYTRNVSINDKYQGCGFTRSTCNILIICYFCLICTVFSLRRNMPFYGDFDQTYQNHKFFISPCSLVAKAMAFLNTEVTPIFSAIHRPLPPKVCPGRGCRVDTSGLIPYLAS